MASGTIPQIPFVSEQVFNQSGKVFTFTFPPNYRGELSIIDNGANRIGMYGIWESNGGVASKRDMITASDITVTTSGGQVIFTYGATVAPFFWFKNLNCPSPITLSVTT